MICVECGTKISHEDILKEKYFIAGCGSLYLCDKCAASCYLCGQIFLRNDLTKKREGLICDECLKYWYYNNSCNPKRPPEKQAQQQMGASLFDSFHANDKPKSWGNPDLERVITYNDRILCTCANESIARRIAVLWRIANVLKLDVSTLEMIEKGLKNDKR